jgi:predicted esterase
VSHVRRRGKITSVRFPTLAIAGISAAAAFAVAAPALLGQAVPATDSAAARTDTVTRHIDESLEAGRVIQRIVSRADTTQRYALYLPSGFNRDRQWPVLFLLDPRGRALVPMARFQPVAERLGYIVLSSYNTLSDGPPEPNYSAMNAMLEDVQRALPVNSRRLYLVGFSGTARFAWELNTRLPGTITGIIGAGASVPGNASSWTRANIGKSSPVLFGTIGTLDPNYEELRTFDAELDTIGAVHHIERFDGVHQWPPSELSTRAVEWLDLQAMRRGLAPRNQAWIDSLYASWFARAARVDSTGDAASAVREFRLVRADFDGLTNVGAATARLAVLEKDPRVRRTVATENAIATRDRQLNDALVSFAAEIKSSASPPSINDARKRLDLDALRREAARTDDSTAAIAARRALERIFAHMSFYAPRDFFDERRYAHAAFVLQIARLIKPDDGFACFWQARALAQTGDKPNALAALECAAASKQVSAAAIESDPLLAPLHADPRYEAVVRALQGSR